MFSSDRHKYWPVGMCLERIQFSFAEYEGKLDLSSEGTAGVSARGVRRVTARGSGLWSEPGQERAKSSDHVVFSANAEVL